jgi:hypothetical protein
VSGDWKFYDETYMYAETYKKSTVLLTLPDLTTLPFFFDDVI